jgi:hypothetical protein
MYKGTVMLNKVTVGLLLLSVLGYAASVAVGDPFVYILCFVFLVLAVLFGLLVLATNLTWRLFPSRLKKTHEVKTSRFKTTILLSVPLAFIIADAINDEYLADSSRLISVLGNAGVMVFTIFVAWSFIKRSRWRTIFASSGIFVVFIGLLSFVGSAVPKSSEAVSTDSVDKLKSLGYVAWVPAEAEDGSGKIKTGVTVYDPNLAFDGLNLYNSWKSPEAYLIDMHGRVVHKWAKNIYEGDLGGHVEICENGDLLVVATHFALVRLDWDSNVKWNTKIGVHHDVSADNKEQLYTLAREDRLVFCHGIPTPIPVDYIAVLSADGVLKKKVYLYDIVKENISLQTVFQVHKWFLTPKNLRDIFARRGELRGFFRPARDRCFDITHTNSIEIMDRDIEGFCRNGDWLISIRQLDLVAILNPQKEEFTWSWGQGELDRQHHPTLLENENVLIFDNGLNRGFTRVIELDPLTRKIVWEYRADPPEKFFSAERGSCQRLPNGNTLITESQKGRVFEVTKEGEIVWEFYNPDIKGKGKKREKDKKRATIYRMMRVTYPVKLNIVSG